MSRICHNHQSENLMFVRIVQIQRCIDCAASVPSDGFYTLEQSQSSRPNDHGDHYRVPDICVTECVLEGTVVDEATQLMVRLTDLNDRERLSCKS